MQLHHRGDPGFFFGGGAPLRKPTGQWGKEILKVNMKKKASSRGGGGTPPVPTPVDLPLQRCVVRKGPIKVMFPTESLQTSSIQDWIKLLIWKTWFSSCWTNQMLVPQESLHILLTWHTHFIMNFFPQQKLNKTKFERICIFCWLRSNIIIMYESETALEQQIVHVNVLILNMFVYF